MSFPFLKVWKQRFGPLYLGAQQCKNFSNGVKLLLYLRNSNSKQIRVSKLRWTTEDKTYVSCLS